MTVFWITTCMLALGVTIVLTLAMLWGRRAAGSTADYDLRVYRDQLAEVDKDILRGVIAAEDAERVRTEVSRRILAADSKAKSSKKSAHQSTGITRAAIVVVGLTLVAGSVLLYRQLGVPGYADLALETRKELAKETRLNRPSQADAESQTPAETAPEAGADYLALVEKLREAVQSRPNDLQGYTLLARSEAALGNYEAAYGAHQRILSLKGDAATADDYSDLAGMMILAAGGYVSPEAQSTLEAALQRDPQNGASRYYGGLMMAQTGRPDVAFRMWEDLLGESTPKDPWYGPIRTQIEELAFRAGANNFTLPDVPVPAVPPNILPGPTQDDVNNAAELSASDRQDMIQGMVARLSDRLATEGGTPEDWARLLTAYGVLGDQDQANAIWANAQQVFAADADALNIVRQGAIRAGIAE